MFEGMVWVLTIAILFSESETDRLSIENEVYEEAMSCDYHKSRIVAEYALKDLQVVHASCVERKPLAPT